VNRDLFDAALGGNVLSAGQLGAPTVAGQTDEILGHQRYGAPRTLRPRGVGRRIDYNLADDPPTSVVRITSRNEKPGESLGHPYSPRLGPVAVQVTERGADVTAVVHRPGEFPRCPPGLLSYIVDPPTVLGRLSAASMSASARRPLVNVPGCR
jgi:hypothetical protein